MDTKPDIKPSENNKQIMDEIESELTGHNKDLTENDDHITDNDNIKSPIMTVVEYSDDSDGSNNEKEINGNDDFNNINEQQQQQQRGKDNNDKQKGEEEEYLNSCHCADSHLLNEILRNNDHIVNSIMPSTITNEMIYSTTTGVNLPISSLISKERWLKHYEDGGWTKEFDAISFDQLQSFRVGLNRSSPYPSDTPNDDLINTWFVKQSLQTLTMLKLNHRLNRVLTCLTHSFEWVSGSDNPPIGKMSSVDFSETSETDIITLLTNRNGNCIVVNNNDNDKSNIKEEEEQEQNNTNNIHSGEDNNSGNTNNNDNKSTKQLTQTECIELKLNALEFLCVLVKEKFIRENVYVHLHFDSPIPLPNDDDSNIKKGTSTKNIKDPPSSSKKLNNNNQKVQIIINKKNIHNTAVIIPITNVNTNINPQQQEPYVVYDDNPKKETEGLDSDYEADCVLQ